MVRILLTNDDGIGALGLTALEEAFHSLRGVELWTVAPDSQRSACSHAMTLGKPVSVHQLGERRYGHSGVVADGVYWAIVHLMAQNPPDVVVSGINRGANLAEDVIYSGTVAGAREAVLRKIHGIAVSLVEGEDFSRAAKNVARIAMQLATRSTQSENGDSMEAPVLLNVNYPPGEFGGPELCRLGSRPYMPRVQQTRGSQGDGYLIGGPPIPNILPEPGTDVALIKDGKASMTPLLIDQTEHGILAGDHLVFLTDRGNL